MISRLAELCCCLKVHNEHNNVDNKLEYSPQESKDALIEINNLKGMKCEFCSSKDDILCTQHGIMCETCYTSVYFFQEDVQKERESFEQFQTKFNEEIKEKRTLIEKQKERERLRNNAIGHLLNHDFPEFSKFVEREKLWPKGCTMCGQAHLTSLFLGGVSRHRFYDCPNNTNPLDYIEVKYEKNFGYYIVDGVRIATVLWFDKVCYNNVIHKIQTAFLTRVVTEVCQKQFHGPCVYITKAVLEYIGRRLWICLKD